MSTSDNDTQVEKAILRTLTYFDIFNYPLTIDEIRNFLGLKASRDLVFEATRRLVKSGVLYTSKGFYSLQFSEQVFDRRIKGNLLAQALAPSIVEKAKTIARFPFVRAVLASGSFSKNYMDENSDFDFFVISAPDRVWISRMLLVLYKKLFLKNSHKHFCINYFVDEENLEIRENNIFNATELATVIPLVNSNMFNSLIKTNKTWLDKYFPNADFQQPRLCIDTLNPLMKGVMERMTNLFFPSHLNRLFKKITMSRWTRVYRGKYSHADFNLAFRSTDGISKNHPRNYQTKIVSEYERRIALLAKKVAAA